jgi:hypothetical protein
MKAIKFKEKDKYSLTISKGEYLIDKKPVSIDSYNSIIEVVGINNVRPITRVTIVDYYICGDDKLTIEEYNNKKQLLLTNRKEIDEDEFVWDSLESEFEYRKFISKWTKVTKNIENIGDPYSIEILEANIDSGCKYVKSDYINGGTDPMLFIYNRKSAVLDIVRNKFTELGMDFVHNCSYANTKNSKVWTNSTHSVIRYVAAFNRYIFNDRWDIKQNPRGSMDSLLAKYKYDKETLESIIEIGYNEHFGFIDSGKFDFKKLLDELNGSKNLLSSVESKQKTISNHRSGIKKLNDAIEFIKIAYELK